MSKLLDLHGWKLVTLLAAFMLSCSLAISAWMVAPPRYSFEKVRNGSYEKIYKTDRQTGQVTYAGGLPMRSQ